MAESTVGILEWKQRLDHFIRVVFGKEDAVLREFKWAGVLFDENARLPRASVPAAMLWIPCP